MLRDCIQCAQPLCVGGCANVLHTFPMCAQSLVMIRASLQTPQCQYFLHLPHCHHKDGPHHHQHGQRDLEGDVLVGES